MKEHEKQERYTITDNIVTLRIGDGKTIVYHFDDADNRDAFESYLNLASRVEVFNDRS